MKNTWVKEVVNHFLKIIKLFRLRGREETNIYPACTMYPTKLSRPEFFKPYIFQKD